MAKLKQTKKVAPKAAATWTQFWDMHSGGSTKIEPFEKIYIEAPEAEARAIFYNRFKRNPERVTCTCCGSDYSISESASLEQATAFHRNCDYDDATDSYVERQEPRKLGIRERCDTKSTDPWGQYLTVEQYAQQSDVLIIRADEIKPSERAATIPEQGYVWVD